MKSQKLNTYQRGYQKTSSSWINYFPIHAALGTHIPDNLAVHLRSGTLEVTSFAVKQMFHFNKSSVDKNEALIFRFDDYFGSLSPIEMTDVNGNVILPFNELSWYQGHMKGNTMIPYGPSTSSSNYKHGDKKKPRSIIFRNGYINVNDLAISAKSCFVNYVEPCADLRMFSVDNIHVNMNDISKSSFSSIYVSMYHINTRYHGRLSSKIHNIDLFGKYFGYDNPSRLAKYIKSTIDVSTM